MARYELNLRDYYRILRRHLIVIIAVSVGLGGLSWALSLDTDESWSASSVVQITQASDIVDLMLEAVTYSSGDEIATKTMLISSQPVLWETIKQLDASIDTSITYEQVLDGLEPENPAINLYEGYWDQISMFAGDIQAQQVGFSGLIEITATSDVDEDYTVKLAMAAARGFKAYSSQKAREQNTSAEKFINERLTDINEELNQVQIDLRDFRRSNFPFTSFDAASLTTLIERRTMLEDRTSTLTELKLRLEEGEAGFSTVGAAIDPTILSQYAENYSELSTLLSNRGRQLLTYTENAEPIRVLDERIGIVKGELTRSIDKDLALIRTSLARYDSLLAAFPDEEVDLASLTRQVDLKTQLVTQLETNLQEVRIRAAGTHEEVAIVGVPTVASSDQTGSTPLKTVIGLLLGFMLGIVIAFIVETMDTSIGTIEDVEEYIEVPVLAVIPHLPVEKMSEQLVEQNPQLENHPHLGMFARLITQYDSKSPAAEAYRTLRTNLQFAIGGTGESIETKNTFVFTSSSLQEGKSTTMANLAITVAQAGNRVLLMGCNMRRPTVYKSFGLTLENGMTDILTGQKDWRECVKGITDMMVGPLSLQNIMQMPGLDNLSIVTAGGIPPNPSELLSSPRFAQMIEEASEEYDMVLVDCPPILPVTDAAIVGRQVDWAVLIYQVGKVPRNALRRAKFHLSNVGAHVLGLAMNDVKAEIGGYSPYSQYMTKYYGEGADDRKTLLGIIRGLFKKGDKEFVEKRDRERADSHRITGGKDDAPWVKIDYFEKTDGESEEKRGGESEGPGQDGVIEDLIPDKPDEEEREDAGDGDGAWFNRIPLWAWIALAAAVVLLVLSMLLGSCSGSSAQTVTDTLPTTVTQDSDPPSTTPSAIESPARTSLVWSVHVGSFRTPEAAESMKNSLGALHLSGAERIWTRIEEVPGLGEWHRVFIGMYEEKEKCSRAAGSLRDTGQVAMARVRQVTPPAP
ncbi:polysaccharide biosynthesis tyrosine autokinase [Gemmatimonadota bacterium]